MREERRVDYRIGREPGAPPERVIRELAARQYGVVARRQLLDAGLTERMVDRRVARGRLLRLHRGVYAVGHAHLRREGHWLAAVLAVGPGAVLSRRDAAALHGLRPPGDHPRVEVVTAGRAVNRRGIAVHQTAVLTDEDVGTRAGVPVTSVARTLVDLAGVVRQDQLAKALSEAERLSLLDVDALERALARTAGRRGPGHAAVREELAELRRAGATLTRSVLEDRFRALLGEAGLPLPQTNVHLDGHEVDALWREQRLVVELDGWRYHRSRLAFQRDRAKDARLTVAGYAVLRFTHADVAERPGWVATMVRDMLAAAAPSAARATMWRPCP